MRASLLVVLVGLLVLVPVGRVAAEGGSCVDAGTCECIDNSSCDDGQVCENGECIGDNPPADLTPERPADGCAVAPTPSDAFRCRGAAGRLGGPARAPEAT